MCGMRMASEKMEKHLMGKLSWEDQKLSLEESFASY